MTSEVIIRNKKCVVLAADSAVTISRNNNSKVYNSANKLFSLSKYQPVGILVYNNASINGIPIELIVKGYRETLKEKQFPTIAQYAKHFKSTIKAYVSEHISVQDKEDQMGVLFSDFLVYIAEIHHRNNQGYEDILNNQKHEITQIIQNDKIRLIPSVKLLPYITSNAQIKHLFQMFQSRESTVISFEDLVEVFILYIHCSINYTYTGVAICGYWSKEIYPNVSQFNVVGFVGDEFIIIGEKDHIVENDIIPLAQRDMMDTFICGVSPQILYKFSELLNIIITKILNNIKDALEINDAVFQGLISEIQKELPSSFSPTDFIDRTQIDQIVAALDSLSKEEVAELAENLVNLQILKYKVSYNLETVGGPIDVAIISKYDGFIWKKRKFYFPADLNFHFFENYFKK